jgi:hypothetical protein
MEIPELGQIEVREYIAIHHDKRVIDPCGTGGEPHRSGRIERFGFNRIVQLNAGTVTVWVRVKECVGAITESEYRIGDAVGIERAQNPLDHRSIDDRKHLLWC